MCCWLSKAAVWPEMRIVALLFIATICRVSSAVSLIHQSTISVLIGFDLLGNRSIGRNRISRTSVDWGSAFKTK